MAILKASVLGQNPAYRSSLDLSLFGRLEGGHATGPNLLQMEYFRERAKPALIGLVVGLIVGWFQPMILGVKPPTPEARMFMTMQMGLAFTMIGLFVANYVAVRRRALAKYSKTPPK